MGDGEVIRLHGRGCGKESKIGNSPFDLLPTRGVWLQHLELKPEAPVYLIKLPFRQDGVCSAASDFKPWEGT